MTKGMKEGLRSDSLINNAYMWEKFNGERGRGGERGGREGEREREMKMD